MEAGFLNLRRAWLLAGALLLASGTGFAADRIRTEPVHFKKGTSGAVIQSRIKGYEIVDYVLGARAGQSMNVSMATRNTSAYFNILAPGENEVAMFIGSDKGSQFEGALPATGNYKIRVYMMRSAARRNEVANYWLEINIGGAGQTAAPAPGHDAKVAGTPYNATGQVPCSMGHDQPTGSCAFGVEREGGGNAMVTVTRPDGRKRVIFFEHGRPTGYDKSQADRGEFRATKEGDLNIIRIGDERYEIVDAVAEGG